MTNLESHRILERIVTKRSSFQSRKFVRKLSA